MDHSHHGRTLSSLDNESLINLFLVLIAAVATWFSLSVNHNPALDMDWFTLVFLFDAVFALWAAYYLPTTRVIGLFIVGAVIGYCTESTAGTVGLWKYLNGPGIASGIGIYMISAVAMMGPVYIVNRLLSRFSFGRTTGWLNAFLTAVVFLSLFILIGVDHPQYLAKFSSDWIVPVYYCALFGLAVTAAYCMRLSVFLGIVFTAALVSLVGQYAGGTQAHIWTFLPGVANVNFPPYYLIFTLWPLEFLVEYAVSSLISDLLTRFTKGARQTCIEKGKCPIVKGTDLYIDQKDSIDIDFFERRNKNETVMQLLERIGRRSFLKTFRKSPEAGELMVAVVGMLLVALAVFEKTLAPCDYYTAVDYATILVFAFIVSPRLFYKRAAWLMGIGAVICFSIYAGVGLFAGLLDANAWFFGKFTWAPFSALLILATYGFAYLLGRSVAKVFHWVDENYDMTKEHGEPKTTLAISALVVCLIFLVTQLVIAPLLMGDQKGYLLQSGSPLLMLFFGTILIAYVFWWFLGRLRGYRLFVQLATALLFGWLFGYRFLGVNSPDTGLLVLNLCWLSFALAYLFAFTGSADLAAEPLAKGFYPNYRRFPKIKNKKLLDVYFHGGPSPTNPYLRREFKDGTLHTYPSKTSAVNVSFAGEIPEDKQKSEQTIEEVLQKSLKGLRAHFPNPADPTQTVNSVAEAVAGKKVFIKPNLVVPCASPYTTSTDLVAEVIRFCQAAGAKEVVVGEIAISNITSRMTMEATGVMHYWLNLSKPDCPVSVLLLDELPFRKLHLQDTPGRQTITFSWFHMPESLLEGDTFYIDIPKMKTHLQSSVTLGIKNSHGLVPETDRGLCHQRIAQKVVDITKVWMPDLTIIDGYDALEGIGPWPGELVPLRTLVVSNDVVLADLVASQLMVKEAMEPDIDWARPVNMADKFVKSHWLAYDQKMGILNEQEIVRTINDGTGDLPWPQTILKLMHNFKRPDYRDEGLIMNIGARVGRMPDFNKDIREYDPHTGQVEQWDPNIEYLPLDRKPPTIDAPPETATSKWGPALLLADEHRYPHLGASVMFSGVFGLMKTLLEGYFHRELNMLDGFVVIYGPLRKPITCEGALLFGDGAIETEYMVFAPRIYHLAGHGRPPNKYSETFERLAQEMGGKLVGFTTEVITFARGWYW